MPSRAAPAGLRWFSGESVAEAGGSWWAATSALLCTRALSGLLTLSATAYATSLQGHAAFLSPDLWGGFLAALGFLGACAASAALALCGGGDAARDGAGARRLARFAGPVYCAGAAAAFWNLVSVRYFPLRFAPPSETWWTAFALVDVAPALLVLLDFALGASIQFRVGYAVLPQMVFLCHTLSVLAYVERRAGQVPGAVARAYVVFHAEVLACTVFAILLSRLQACRQPRPPSEDAPSEDAGGAT